MRVGFRYSSSITTREPQISRADLGDPAVVPLLPFGVPGKSEFATIYGGKALRRRLLEDSENYKKEEYDG